MDISTILPVRRCPKCSSRELTWNADTKEYGSVQVFYLGCDECSETIRVIDGDKVAAMLTAMQVEIVQKRSRSA